MISTRHVMTWSPVSAPWISKYVKKKQWFQQDMWWPGTSSTPVSTPWISTEHVKTSKLPTWENSDPRISTRNVMTWDFQHSGLRPQDFQTRKKNLRELCPNNSNMSWVGTSRFIFVNKNTIIHIFHNTILLYLFVAFSVAFLPMISFWMRLHYNKDATMKNWTHPNLKNDWWKYLDTCCTCKQTSMRKSSSIYPSNVMPAIHYLVTTTKMSSWACTIEIQSFPFSSYIFDMVILW